MAHHDGVLEILQKGGTEGVEPDAIMKKMSFTNRQQLHGCMTRLRRDGHKIKSPGKAGRYILLPPKRQYNMENQRKAKPKEKASWVMMYVGKAKSLVSIGSREAYLDRVHKEIENKLIEEAILEANNRIIAIRTAM